MKHKLGYSHTICACCAAYMTQAIAVNFAPLLFITFRNTYSLSLAQISALVTVTFVIQLAVDVLSAKAVHRIGYRASAVTAHVISAAGFIMLGILPDVLENSYLGILMSCVLYSFGCGLIEVIVSPIVESCPTDNKASAMAFLHSFYSWGTVLVIGVSTAYFTLFGIENWRVMSIIWAVLPIMNAVFFMFVPIKLNAESEGMSMSELLRQKIIWMVILLMICSGAAELAMSQWASAFAESAVGVSKSVGDIAGPCMFAVLMGTGRIVCSKIVKRIELMRYMVICAVLCIASYLLAALSGNAVFALAGCAMTGFAVGVFWPGTLSYAANKCPMGGAAMFGLLACAGDVGCTVGPVLVGFVSGIFNDRLNAGLLSAVIFPIILLVTAAVLANQKGKKDEKLK